MNWKYTIDIKDLHDGYEEKKYTIVEVAHKLAEKLMALKMRSDLKPMLSIISLESFDETYTADDYDYILSDIYDWADNNKVWIKRY